MFEAWWNDLVDALAPVPADFAFLVALPFFVVAVAFLPELWRRLRRPGFTRGADSRRAASPERTTRPV